MVWLAVRQYVDAHRALALVITHRDTTIESADEVVELKAGRIAAHRRLSDMTESVSTLHKALGT